MKGTQVQFRVTEEERDLMKRMAAERGFTSMSEYVLTLVRNDSGLTTDHLTLAEIATLREMIKERG